MSGLLRGLAARAMNRSAPVRSQTATLQSQWRRVPANDAMNESALAEQIASMSTRDDETTQQAPHELLHSSRTGQEPVGDVSAAVHRRAALESAPTRAAEKHVTIDAHETAIPAPLVRIAALLRTGDESPTRALAGPVLNVPAALVRDDIPHKHTAAEMHATPRAAEPAPPAIATRSPRKESAHDAAPTEVHVSIGRIELTALAPPAPARPAVGSSAARAPRSTVTLADYLRNGAGRRP